MSRDLNRRHLSERLRDASTVARVVADETFDLLEAHRLEALANTLDAERRCLGEQVPVRRRVSGDFAEV